MRKKIKKKKISRLILSISVVLLALVALYFSPWNYKKLNVPNYNQMELGIPEGCEGVSLLQGFHYKNEATDLEPVEFLDQIPRANSPYEGFAGNPFVTQKHIYSAIFDEPLTEWASNYGDVRNISDSSASKLYKEVKAGKPVVVWVTVHFKPIRNVKWKFGEAPGNNHAVLLAGYNRILNKVYVSDPVDGEYWMSKTKFEKIYHARKMAVVVE